MRFLSLKVIAATAVVITVITAAIVFLPPSQQVQVRVTQPGDTIIPNNPTDPASTPGDSQVSVVTDTGTYTISGTAWVTVTVHFFDGTSKVITSTVQLLTVTSDGKRASSFQYQLEVQWTCSGTCPTSSMSMSNKMSNIFLVSESGHNRLVYHQDSSDSTVQLGQRMKIVDISISARSLEQDVFNVALSVAPGSMSLDYTLTFFTSLTWALPTISPAQASITGPDVPITITTVTPADGDGGCPTASEDGYCL